MQNHPSGAAAASRTRPGVAVFVCSSDNRRDVLDRVLPSVAKFWPDCPYPVYVGLNSSERPLALGAPVLAPASEWHSEFSQQLAQIEEEHLIVVLDDFLFGAPVDQARLAELVNDARTLGISYLRLVPLGRSLPSRLKGSRHPEVTPGIERVPAHRPFYSALQIAIWNKRYLQAMLQTHVSIWEFEHLCVEQSLHGAIKDRSPIAYRHLVERGRWLPDAQTLLRRAGLPTELGSRQAWSKARYASLMVDQVRWVVLGYATS